MTSSWTLDALAAHVGAVRRGEDREVRGVCAHDALREAHVVVAPDEDTLRVILASPAARRLAALVHPPALDDAASPPRLLHDDPRLMLARLTHVFATEEPPATGIAADAHVDPGAQLATGVSVAAGATIGAGAVLEEGCMVGPRVVVGAGCHVGTGTRLFAGVVLYPGVRLGDRVRVHAGAVLGADGFGYAAGPRGPEKIHHLGAVDVRDDAEIGANTCIDRGTLSDTVVGARTKIDNLCQVGHNVVIGQDCLIAGMSAIGGSTVLEDGVVVGGGAGLADHVRIGHGARLAARAGVSKDVPAGEAWGGAPAAPMRAWARERYLISRLERIWAFVRKQDDGR